MGKRAGRGAALLAAAVGPLAVALGALVAPGVGTAAVRIERANTTAAGDQAEGSPVAWYGRFNAAMTPDGRYVAFASWSTNLVPGDTNGQPDVFVKDRQTGEIQRANTAADGTEARGFAQAYVPALSGDGRYVAFVAGASNLVPGDTNGWADVFVKDRQTGAIERVSVAADGAQANNASTDPVALSADGRYAALISDASNLVPGDTNGNPDVFVVDRSVPAGAPTPTGTPTATPTGTPTPTATATPSPTPTPRYAFAGFFPPLAPSADGSVVNTGKAGRTYPVKWQLRDESGTLVTRLGAVASVQVEAVACGTLTATADPIDAETAGTSGLRYDAAADQFVYTWQTPSVPGCYLLRVSLDDGSLYKAAFNLS